jgi:ectoine hydroxylase-related dioxygenase (phytanoyl-CoA dioxygenase family)
VSIVEEHLVEHFQAQGATVVRGLVDPTWIDALRGAVDELLEQGRDRSARLADVAPAGEARSVDGMWRGSDLFARFLHESPIADAAADAMRSASVTLYEDLFLHTAAEVTGASWHRDSPHWPVTGSQLSSVWFSLEPVTAGTGALHFVAGSHLDDAEQVKGEGLIVVADPLADGREIVGWETEPGDAVVFHPRALHSALGASPDRPRRTFTIRFAGDDVRWRPRSSYYHPWMRDAGLDRGDRLDHMWFPILRPTVAGARSDRAAGQPVA